MRVLQRIKVQNRLNIGMAIVISIVLIALFVWFFLFMFPSDLSDFDGRVVLVFFALIFYIWYLFRSVSNKPYVSEMLITDESLILVHKCKNKIVNEQSIDLCDIEKFHAELVIELRTVSSKYSSSNKAVAATTNIKILKRNGKVIKFTEDPGVFAFSCPYSFMLRLLSVSHNIPNFSYDVIDYYTNLNEKYEEDLYEELETDEYYEKMKKDLKVQFPDSTDEDFEKVKEIHQKKRKEIFEKIKEDFKNSHDKPKSYINKDYKNAIEKVQEDLKYYILHGKRKPVTINSIPKFYRFLLACLILAWLGCAGWLIYIAMPSYPNETDKTYASIIDEGFEAYKKRDTDTALKKYDVALNMHTEDSALYYYRALAYERAKNYEKAVEEAKKGLEYSKKKSKYKYVKNEKFTDYKERLYTVLGPSYYNLENYEAAKEAYTYLIQHSSYKYKNTYFKRGKCEYHLQNKEAALADFQKHKEIIELYIKEEEQSEYKSKNPIYTNEDLSILKKWINATKKIKKIKKN